MSGIILISSLLKFDSLAKRVLFLCGYRSKTSVQWSRNMWTKTSRFALLVLHCDFTGSTGIDVSHLFFSPPHPHFQTQNSVFSVVNPLASSFTSSITSSLASSIGSESSSPTTLSTMNAKATPFYPGSNTVESVIGASLWHCSFWVGGKKNPCFVVLVVKCHVWYFLSWQVLLWISTSAILMLHLLRKSWRSRTTVSAYQVRI